MREQKAFAAMRAAGLRDVAAERFGFLPPFVVNRPFGPRVEVLLERLPWQRFLAFQLFRGDVAHQGARIGPASGLE
jgi:hypothetical protein